MLEDVILIVLAMISIITLIIIVISFRLSGMIVSPKICDPDKSYIDEIAKGQIDKNKYEEDYHREDFTLQSDYGYSLSGSSIPKIPYSYQMNPMASKEMVVVFAHGYSYCQYGSVKYIDIFRKLGFHCVIYDHRNHGYSDKAVTTMGYYEARDLKKICDYIREKLGEDIILGTHGESMGGATVMINAALDPKLTFVIEDCGYSDLSSQLSHNMKTIYRLPRFPFLRLGSAFSKLRGGVYFSQVIPKNELARCEAIPILFLHGDEDDFVPTYMVQDNYNAKKGYRRMRIFPNSGHAESYIKNKEEYSHEIEDFLKEIVLL